MLGLWFVLSGRLDLLHLGMGIVCSAIVALFSADLLFESLALKRLAITFPRWLAYTKLRSKE